MLVKKSLAPAGSKLAVRDTFPPYPVPSGAPPAGGVETLQFGAVESEQAAAGPATDEAERGYRAPRIVDDADEVVIGCVIRIRVGDGCHDGAARSRGDDDVTRRNAADVGTRSGVCRPTRDCASTQDCAGHQIMLKIY